MSTPGEPTPKSPAAARPGDPRLGRPDVRDGGRSTHPRGSGLDRMYDGEQVRRYGGRRPPDKRHRNGAGSFGRPTDQARSAPAPFLSRLVDGRLMIGRFPDIAEDRERSRERRDPLKQKGQSCRGSSAQRQGCAGAARKRAPTVRHRAAACHADGITSSASDIDAGGRRGGIRGSAPDEPGSGTRPSGR